jgi:DNA helicase-2/ATP-dependent DNA helicase PcrA
VTVLTFESGQHEAEGIAKRIREAVEKKHHTYRDVAVFVRMNALTRTLELAFTKMQVPFQIVRGLAFYDRKENRDVLAYLRLLLNPRDDLSFLRVVNEPARGIGKVTLEHLRQYAEAAEVSLLQACGEVTRISALKGKAAKALAEFAEIMRELSKFLDAQPDEVIRQVLDRTGYRQMLRDSKDDEDQERLANIEELVTAAKQFADEDNCHTIADFVENVTLVSDVDGWDQQQDCVSIMTLHAAKGLEFPVVYVVAVEEGILPHERSRHRADEMEEERRLAFVGMTRAKQELHLCHARLREFRGQTLSAIPSKFLDELPAEAVEHVDQSAYAGGSRHRAADDWRRGGGPAAEQGWRDAGIVPREETASSGSGDGGFAPGMLVRHDTYGMGRITDVSGFGALRKVKVRFAAAGERTFVADKVKLEIVRREEPR